jgi:hypothetical protein
LDCPQYYYAVTPIFKNYAYKIRKYVLEIYLILPMLYAVAATYRIRVLVCVCVSFSKSELFHALSINRFHLYAVKTIRQLQVFILELYFYCLF